MTISQTSAEQPTNTALLGVAVGTLSLRLCNTSEAGRVFPITGTRCAIGELSSCDLRFPELDACHCIIVRGRHAALIRCWSSHTRLNGCWFRDAVLRPLDRLTLGPLEFEVLMENDCFQEESQNIGQRVDVQLARAQEWLANDSNAANLASPVEQGRVSRPSPAVEQLEAEVARLTQQVERERVTIAALQAEIERLAAEEPVSETLSAVATKRDETKRDETKREETKREETCASPPRAGQDVTLEHFVLQMLDRIRGKANHSTVPLGDENAPRIESELMEALEFERQAAGPAWEPRTAAPELNADLEAMRRLANDSARSALDHFAWRKSVEYARQHWSYAGFGLFWATVAWLVLKDNSNYLGRSTACIGIGLALVLGGVGALRAVYWKQHSQS